MINILLKFAFVCFLFIGTHTSSVYAEECHIQGVNVRELGQDILLDYAVYGENADAFFDNVLEELHNGKQVRLIHTIDVSDVEHFGFTIDSFKIKRYASYDGVTKTYHAGDTENMLRTFKETKDLETFLMHAYGADMGEISTLQTGKEYDISVEIHAEVIGKSNIFNILTFGLFEEKITAKERYIAH